ncbi:FAD-dependent oxidoreductase [Bacillus sp. FJAT-29790]|uniref:oxidoreductase n=1 Tax=Bacillus sp. FJAT-29790 TaxID=1895002 RepID=UPI001C2391F8|nr:FAD-dependent oxidoreductase [Bacillus sp. FJAT-29790]MBU8878407.1 FAD-dependent oxidoreductase [Bacillus sp. FJAT-29790]
MAKFEKQEEGSFPNLLAPLKVGPMVLRNRVLVSAHNTGLAEGGLATNRVIEYHRTLAAGGPGLQITGATSVHPTGMGSYQSMVNHNDDIISGYQKLAEAVHAEGGKILAQLGHFGAVGRSSLMVEKPLWAPSPVSSETGREIPHQMTKGEIQEIVKAFGHAARRVREGMLDGIEITAGHGLLISEFLSGATNFRNDEYGGSLYNRLRFLLEVIDEVSEHAGPNLIIGVRLSADEKVKGGVDISQAKEIARRLEATGKVHFINVISGTNMDRIQRWAHWPATPAPNGLFVDLAKQIKEVVNIPVFTVGRITDPMHAEEILSTDAADMVGMTRAHIADPNIVKKISQGRTNDIRPCVGANVCIARTSSGHSIRCIHNPEAGRADEMTSLSKTGQPKRVAVIGGGPAGLEASRVAAIRGHSVELFERQGKLGGQLRLWATSPSMNELHKIIEWQEDQLEKLDVKVHLNSEMTIDEIIKMTVDTVIVATGSLPQSINSRPWVSHLPGITESNIVLATPHELLEGKISEPKKVIVWDHAGGVAGSQIALSAAEKLVENGAEVHIITPNFAVGEDIHPTMRTPLYQRLLSAGTVFTPNSKVLDVEGSNVVIRNVFSHKDHLIPNVDVLVTCLGNGANDYLYHALDGQLPEVYAIGDCLAPRTVEIAMTEGARIARIL